MTFYGCSVAELREEMRQSVIFNGLVVFGYKLGDQQQEAQDEPIAHGTPTERANFQFSGAGYGIHWPELDEDIGVEGLLLGKKSTESPASFERWLTRRKKTQPQSQIC